MLLKAPNVQLTAQRIELALDLPLDEEELGNGLLLYALIHESSMQPFGDNNPPSFFTPGAVFQVRVFPDPFSEIATAHGPGLAPNFDAASSSVEEYLNLSAEAIQPLAIGTMRLGHDMFVDYIDLNKQDFRVEDRISGYTEKSISQAGRPSQHAVSFASQSEQPKVVN